MQKCAKRVRSGKYCKINLLAEVDFDTAENEPFEVSQKLGGPRWQCQGVSPFQGPFEVSQKLGGPRFNVRGYLHSASAAAASAFRISVFLRTYSA